MYLAQICPLCLNKYFWRPLCTATERRSRLKSGAQDTNSTWPDKQQNGSMSFLVSLQKMYNKCINKKRQNKFKQKASNIWHPALSVEYICGFSLIFSTSQIGWLSGIPQGFKSGKFCKVLFQRNKSKKVLVWMKENSQRAQCFQLDTWKLYFRHSVCFVMLRDVPRDALERELPHQHPTPPTSGGRH